MCPDVGEKQNSVFGKTICLKNWVVDHEFRKNIEFVDGLFWFCKETPVHDLTVENFLKFVKINEKDYSNLIKFLNRAETQAKLLS